MNINEIPVLKKTAFIQIYIYKNKEESWKKDVSFQLEAT